MSPKLNLFQSFSDQLFLLHKWYNFYYFIKMAQSFCILPVVIVVSLHRAIDFFKFGVVVIVLLLFLLLLL